MNKIYNNLSIENLKKTEWFNQFDYWQKALIRAGLKEGLDISIYAKKEFDSKQMGQIRSGLNKGLDVSIYAKPEFDSLQMEEIKIGLENNLNVSVYAKKEIPSDKMFKIRKKLLEECVANNVNIVDVSTNWNTWVAKKKYVLDEDIIALVAGEAAKIEGRIKLAHFEISRQEGKKPKAVSPNQEENMLPHILTSSLEGKYNEFCESNKLIAVEYQNTIMLMDGSNSGRVAIGHNGVIGSTLAKINFDNNKLWAVIYQFLKHKEADIQANTTGTTIPHTDKNRINNYLMTIPNDFLLDKFTELFDNSLLKIISNRNQIISLETIRDLLLPRLLSGVI